MLAGTGVSLQEEAAPSYGSKQRRAAWLGVKVLAEPRLTGGPAIPMPRSPRLLGDPGIPGAPRSP
jgi:hypothetical protein